MSAAGVRGALALLAVGVLAAGCAGDGEVTGTDDGNDPTAAPAATPPAAAGAVPADLVDEARADAAERAGVAAEEVEVVRTEDVQWSSSALGCPEEGQMYTQVITDGYWVVVRTGGEEFDYRAADGGPVRLCEDGGEAPRDTEGG